MSAGTMTRGGPLPMFTLFPTLPTELQIKIWKCALPGPRIIQLHYLEEKGKSSFFFSPRSPPELYTCQTSREVALSVFEPAFTGNDQLRPIYINPAHDTLYFATNPETCRRTAGLYPDIKEKIQSLAVEILLEDDLEKSAQSAIHIRFSHFSNLKEIIFVVNHTQRLLECKNAEQVRFSEPKATERWKMLKGWMGELFFPGYIVRVVEAKMVLRKTNVEVARTVTDTRLQLIQCCLDG